MSFVVLTSLLLISADFPICTDAATQYYPAAIFENDQYYVFWTDHRYYSPDYAIYGARIALDGTVLDADGKILFRNQSAYAPAVAYDGVGFMVAFRDSC